MTPTTPLNSVDLPAPFGPTTAVSEPVAHRAVEMMHRRMAVIAERQIAEAKLRGHRRHRVAQNTAAQISAISAAAKPSRCSADSRRIDGMHRGRRMRVARVVVVVRWS